MKKTLVAVLGLFVLSIGSTVSAHSQLEIAQQPPVQTAYAAPGHQPEPQPAPQPAPHKKKAKPAPHQGEQPRP